MVFLGFVAFMLLGSMNWTSCSSKKAMVEAPAPEATKPAPENPPPPPAPRPEPKFITAIKEKVKGKEQMPAEEVFENIEILKGMQAGRVLPIMQRAFNQSLGVKCNHCHKFGEWASDEKPQKKITRDMWNMTAKINQDLLANIEGLTGPNPVVNCTTCHRGDIKPGLSMEAKE
jgi:hypothetical protein